MLATAETPMARDAHELDRVLDDLSERMARIELRLGLPRRRAEGGLPPPAPPAAPPLAPPPVEPAVVQPVVQIPHAGAPALVGFGEDRVKYLEELARRRHAAHGETETGDSSVEPPPVSATNDV